MKTTLASKQLSFWYGSMLSRRVAILICGKAGVGKSTTGNIIQDRLRLKGYSTYVGSFSKELKQIAWKDFEWDGEKDDKGRKLLQNIGKAGRDYNPNVWASKLIRSVDSIPSLDIVIVDDWRFYNECKMFEDNFYQIVTIRIVAPEREILRNTPFYSDISEVSLDGIETDFVINNSGSVEELEGNVDKVIVEILKKE